MKPAILGCLEVDTTDWLLAWCRTSAADTTAKSVRLLYT